MKANRVQIMWQGAPTREERFIGEFFISQILTRRFEQNKSFVVDVYEEVEVEKRHTYKEVQQKINESSIKLFGWKFFNIA